MSSSVRAIAVSMGDPAGAGPEIAAAAWRAGAPPFYVIGDPEVFAKCGGVPVAEISTAGEAALACGDALPVLPLRVSGAVTPGRPDPGHAPAILGAIEAGVAHVLSGEAAALVTLPIAKAPLYEAGFRFPGHTEFLAHLTRHAPHLGPRGPVMLLAGATLRVALATVHLAVKDVPAALSVERIVDVARVVEHALRTDFAIARPRLALLGLNPHAGEAGALGREEIEVINPAAALLRAQGIAATDALAADAAFHPEARAGYDAAIAMYHDQGLIPLKTLHFWDAVNVTLGLPIVRASPDHGTGFDIAGKGVARPDSFIAALRLAAEMAARRRALAAPV